MTAEFIDMEPSAEGPTRIRIANTDGISVLLEELRRRKPFGFELAGENGYSLTIGLATDAGFVQFGATSGASPYLMAVSPARPVQVEDRIHDSYVAAIRADQQAGAVPVEFNFGGTATPVSSRHIVSFEVMKRIAIHFLETGEMYPDVMWEEI